MFVNGIPFFMTVSHNIKFTTIKYATSMSKTRTFKMLEAVIKMYHRRGFRVRNVLGDEQFDPLEPWLAEKYNVIYNPPSANKHIGEIERMIRTVKERICAAISSFPWRKAVPRVIVKETAKHMVMMLNAFPPKSGINTTMSPRNIIAGKDIDYKHHCKLALGEYVQVHEEEKPRNSMAERTLGAICLGPINNEQGGYKFMSLRSGALIRGYAWTPIPMTQEVIDKVISYGEKENVPDDLIIRNGHGDIDFNNFEDDKIKGVYVYDIQNNLEIPQGANDDNSSNSSHSSDSSHSNDENNDDDDDNIDDAGYIDRNDPIGDHEIGNNAAVVDEIEEFYRQRPETVVDELEGNVESIAASIENNMDNAMNEFNEMNNEINNRINQMEDYFNNDETPVKRN